MLLLRASVNQKLDLCGPQQFLGCLQVRDVDKKKTFLFSGYFSGYGEVSKNMSTSLAPDIAFSNLPNNIFDFNEK